MDDVRKVCPAETDKDERIRTLERELREKEALFNQRTAELEQALERAEQASKSKSRFLAQTSHEIRTPLNIVLGMTGLALDEIDNPERVKDYLMKIDSSSRILLSLINDILDMSAIEGGKMKLEARKFDFKSLLTNLSIMYYQQTQKKGIRFDVHLKGVTEDFLLGDELRVNQIILNLVGNAVKFTPAGGTIELEIVQASTSRSRVHMRFIVKDTGCGMSEDMLRRIFKPFEQQNESTARRFGGSGLGLAITKNLLDMMYGSIKVSSQEGKGTEFIVDIPFGRVEQEARPKADQALMQYRAIVVADDEAYCRERGIVLEDMGLSYDCALDAEQALDMIGMAEEEGKPYRVCIVDWRIASMPGLELIREIREIFGNEIIIIGASFEPSASFNRGIEAGANYMVTKPIFRSTLFDALINISKGTLVSYREEIKPQWDFGGRKVLVAEDVALNMEVAVKLLKRVGIEVTCVENGLEAVQVFEKKPAGFFDCIFLDINMPVMDGYQAAREIRKSSLAYAASVPIYAMTANAFTEDVSEALDAGMDGHIAKPIETDVLYATLDKLFS